MAYRRTELVLATREGWRTKIIAAAIDVIKRSGIENLKLPALVERGGFAKGLLYNYFPDIEELRAAVIAHLLDRDLTAMREAAESEKGLYALAAALTILFSRWGHTRLATAAIGSPIYREGVRTELARLIKEAPVFGDLTPKGRTIAAAGAMGALYGLHDVGEGVGRNRPQAAVLFALKGIGLGDAAAQRAAERRYSLAVS